jgi:hypothetical protein
LYINLKKCAFATDCVKFLRFIVRTDSVMIDPSCVETVLKWLTLASFKDV